MCAQKILTKNLEDDRDALRAAGYCGASNIAKCLDCPHKKRSGYNLCFRAKDLQHCPRCKGTNIKWPKYRYCHSRPLEGRNFCRKHRGKSRRGVNHPSYKHGKFSQHAPERYRKSIDYAMENPDTISDLKLELATNRARLVELWGRYRSGESGDSWDKLSSLVIQSKRILDSTEDDNLTDSEFVDLIDKHLDISRKIVRVVVEGASDEILYREVTHCIKLQSDMMRSQSAAVKNSPDWVPVEVVKIWQDQVCGILMAALYDEDDKNKLQDAIDSMERITNPLKVKAGRQQPVN